MLCRLLITTLVIFVSGCATSMTPSQFGKSFPQSTNSKFYEKLTARAAISANECSFLVENRKYIAPIGITLQGDVENGAVGVDEWVKADKGNAYTINNYEWISVPIGNDYATQLIVYFDTLLCKQLSDNATHNKTLWDVAA